MSTEPSEVGREHPLEIEVFERDVSIPPPILGELRDLAPRALAAAAENSLPPSVLPDLAEIEITLVDDREIERVHIEFMDIPGATDVITFVHGEIIVSVDTAERCAADIGHSLGRELALYIIHGLLHLAGYDDRNEEDCTLMHFTQDRLLAQLWSEG